MSEIRYDAHPSLFRMRPFATLLTILLMLAGILAAIFGARVDLSQIPVPQFAGRLDDKMLQIAGIGVFVLSTLQLMLWWLSTRTDRLVITDDELLWTHGLLSKEYTEINMASVRTVRVTQSLLQRVMDAGDVTIFTSGDAPELMVRGLPEPNLIREFVRAQPGT